MVETFIFCPKCKELFNSPISFGDRRSYELAILATTPDSIATCPKCGTVIPVNKENMIFKEGQ